MTTWTGASIFNIDYLESSENVGIIRKVRHILSTKLITALYNSLVLPYLNYCNMIWISASQYRLCKLTVLQKRIVRLIGKAERLEHSGPLFKQHNILKIMDIGVFQKLVFM